MPTTINEDVFLLPHNGGYMVYAPLAGRVVHANADCASQLRSYLASGNAEDVSLAVRSRLGGLDWLHSPKQPFALPTDRHFHPISVTLFLTNRCNLRCTYCYARAGEFEGLDMPVELYRAALDLIMKNARRAAKLAMVNFHGGGEPTLAWETLTGAVDYARQTANAGQVRGLQFGLATNGTASRDRAEYIAKTFAAITLSFDGPPDLQNVQRPKVGGAGSFDHVMSFIDVLRSHKKQFVIRCTVTDKNVGCLVELVDFFADTTGCDQIHFEPVFFSGRCRNTPSAVPLPKVFAETYISAMQRARERRIGIRFSAARVAGIHASFCGCSQDPFNITPDGDVTACYEVCNGADPLTQTYYFGGFNRERQRFEFDFDRLANLRSMTVQNKRLCARCFAKWGCSGDCPVKWIQPYSDADAESPRCQMIQAITRALLEKTLESHHAN